jgi:hypothetical protein
MAAPSGLPLSEPQLCPAAIGTESKTKIRKNGVFPPMAIEGISFRATKATVKE